MSNRAVVISNEEFNAHFFPSFESSLAHNKHSLAELRRIFRSLQKARSASWKEERIAKKFTHIINSHELAPGLTLALSQHRSDPDDDSKRKIDGAFFLTSKAPTDGAPHWADQLVCVEFKSDKTSNDPYDDRDKKPLDSNADSRIEVRGQIISYAELVFKKQQRTHLFTLLIIGECFRVIRWDRSGAVTTPLVDYVKNPDVLCDLLLRMCHVTKEVLGLDPTAVPVRRGTKNYSLMQCMAKPVKTDLPAVHQPVPDNQKEDTVFAYVRKMFKESLDPAWPRWKLEVPQGDGTKRHFLVGKPYFSAKGMTGRGTRGYVAIDTETKKFVWLKDAWRAFYDFVEPEGVVLQQLNDLDVVNVPTFVCHGDLTGQATQSPDVWEEVHRSSTGDSELNASTSGPAAASSSATCSLKRPRALDDVDGSVSPSPPGDTQETSSSSTDEGKCPLRLHIHYRLVVKEVAMPLKNFVSGHHLVSVLFDCLQAHRMAAEQAKILHRDVSGGNILIYPRIKASPRTKGKSIVLKGLLTDWELSKDITNGKKRVARQPERTGTWQYMSASMLSEYGKLVDIPDELESFFHVLLYYSVRYLKSNLSDKSVAHYIERFFEAYNLEDGRSTCGSLKQITMTQPGRLHELLKWFRAHYEVRWYDREEAEDAEAAKSEGSISSSQETDEDEPGFVDEVETPYDAVSIFARKAPRGAQPARVPPSQETRANAAKLADHVHFCSAFSEGAKTGKDAVFVWPGDDKIGDRTPPGSSRSSSR
ncbi:hypothetical protein C8Q79DRAFT_1106035 [Trametes meyenii]|nr:hypothetical protein C8Q79DRAFT_1106035 [Trametes meyenii]